MNRLKISYKIALIVAMLLGLMLLSSGFAIV